MIPGVLSTETKKRKRKRKVSKEEEKGKKRGRRAREPSQSCQLCEFSCETVKEMSQHSESTHPGKTLHCPFPGCQFQRPSYMKVRTHQHAAKHFIIADHSKEKDTEKDAEKTFEFNSIENDEAGIEAKAAEEKKSSESVQEREDSRGELEDAAINDDEVKE